MPNNIVKSFAKKSGKSVKEVEKIWDEVSDYAKSRKDLKEPYAYITGTVEKRLGLKEGLTRYQRLYEARTLKEIEKEARDYYYAAKDPQKARQSVKMRKLEKEWEKLSDGSYAWGDVLA